MRWRCSLRLGFCRDALALSCYRSVATAAALCGALQTDLAATAGTSKSDLKSTKRDFQLSDKYGTSSWPEGRAGHILSRIYNCTKHGNRPIDVATTAHFDFTTAQINCDQLHVKICPAGGDKEYLNLDYGHMALRRKTPTQHPLCVGSASE